MQRPQWSYRHRERQAAAVMLATLACGGPLTAPPAPENSAATRPALSDPGSWTYRGSPGGQSPDGPTMPPAHRQAGLARALAVGPLAPDGSPSPTGRIVLLSIGMSNTTQEFCNPSPAGQCNSGTFVSQALADPAVQKTTLAMVAGARGGQTAGTWDSPADPNYDQVRDSRLAPAGVTERGGYRAPG